MKLEPISIATRKSKLSYPNSVKPNGASKSCSESIAQRESNQSSTEDAPYRRTMRQYCMIWPQTAKILLVIS
ncbi:hypothetical protein SEVIR_1G110300v4 [Setaria viridis]|uniref:Uncharacterized protein n=1 Tax=Setaria italica TaxID=4555 RepID=K3YXD6_SETIT